MALWKNTQHSFSAGQLDALVMGRQDLEKYYSGATLLRNFLVKKQGCVSKRRGTDLVADLGGLNGQDAKGNAIGEKAMRIIPVADSAESGRYIIVSGGVAYTANNDGVLMSNGNRVRKIDAYTAKDDAGRKVSNVSKDDEADDDLPITVLHKVSEGRHKRTRFSQANIQSAFDSTVNGDRIILHGDLIFTDKETPEFRSETFTPSDGVASTFAYSNNYWRMTRSGKTYVATSIGREVDVPQFKIGSVTATRTWAFVADGGHKNRSYKVARYSNYYNYWGITATDSATAAGSEDDLSVSFEIDGETITATRTDTGTAWTFSDGLAWSLSFAGSTWTATRTVGSAKQSDGNNVASNYLATTVSATVDGETVTATSAWTFTDGLAWTPRVGTWLYFDCDGYVSQRASTYWDVTTFTFDKVVKATRDAKQVELDLNGYDVRFVGRSCFSAQTPNVGVTFKTSRRNARVMVTSSGNCHAVKFLLSSSTSSRIGDVVFESGIEWQMNGDDANTLIRINYAKSVTFNGGTFKDTSANEDAMGAMIELSDCDAATFNGGTFDGGLETGCLMLVSPGMSKGIVTVNDGEFILKRPVNKNATCIFRTSYTKGYVINGGRFVCAAESLFGPTRIGARGENYYESVVKLVRGEFTASEMTSWAGKVHPLADFATDGSVANAETHDGYAGIKVVGEADYSWKGRFQDVIPYRVVVPYADADLRDLCARQCGDTMFVVHPSYPPAKFWFDENGELDYEELAFDNTDVFPPVIDAAVMQGQDPKATTAPTANPDWLTAAQKVLKNNFYDTHSAEGTMTDAGFSGNEAQSKDDGTMNAACTYTATVVVKNAASGKKTTHTYALSFTKTVTKEVTTQYTNGVASGSTSEMITTTGSAENDASAAVVMVPRTVRYVATYVKDGRESLPSDPVEIDYEMPWANNAVVNITVSKGRNDEEPDYYNLYKDNGSGYGLVSTTNAETYTGGYTVSLDPYENYAPISSDEKGVALVSVAEFCEKKGWTTSSFMKRLASAPTGYSSSKGGDVGIVLPQSMKETGLDLPTDASFVEIFLDARVKDKISGNTMLVVSQVAATIHVEFEMANADGTMERGTATATYYPDVTTVHGQYSATVGVPKVMCALGQTTYELESGEKIIALNLGTGDQSSLLEKCVRSVLFPNPLAGAKTVTIDRVYVTFDYFYGADIWGDYRYQGAIHALRAYERTPRSIGSVVWRTTWNGYVRDTVNSVKLVYKIDQVKSKDGSLVDKDVCVVYSANSVGSGGSSLGGNFQDDYITPDMTVTPPVEPSEAHFAAEGDYPRTVGLHDQRLVLASTDSSPSTVWFSRTGDLYSFEPHESVREDDAMELTLAATELPDINHLVDGRELLLLTDGGEWTVAPVSGNALTYKTAQMKLQSSIGSDRALQPMQIAGEVLFAERGGGALRAMQYSYGSDSYQSTELTLPAQSLFLGNAIVSICYKQHPDSIVECVLADGRVATLVYDKENEVMAWSVHDFGGGWLARQVVTPKSTSNGTTETMLLVQKGADGKWQMWKVRDDDATMTAKSQVVLDAIHVEEDGTKVADGEVAVRLGDGTSAHGIPITAELVTVRPEVKQGDPLQMELKNATECEVRVANATTFEMKPYAASDGWRETSLEPKRDGEKVELGTADAKRLMTGMNTRDGRIHLRHTAPWPISVLSVSTTYQVEYENGGKK